MNANVQSGLLAAQRQQQNVAKLKSQKNAGPASSQSTRAPGKLASIVVPTMAGTAEQSVPTADALEAGDAALIQATLAGDAHAFERLMRRYNQLLYRTARSILHDESEAEDAVQEAWWKAYTHLGDFRAEAKVSTWLTRIAVNEALMMLRRNKSREAIIQSEYQTTTGKSFMQDLESRAAAKPGDSADHQLWRTEIRQLLERHIDALPDIYRTIFMLRLVDGMPTADVAQALGITETTVRVRLMRARRMLKKGLQKEIDPHLPNAFSFAGERCNRIVEGVRTRMKKAAEADAAQKPRKKS